GTCLYDLPDCRPGNYVSPVYCRGFPGRRKRVRPSTLNNLECSCIPLFANPKKISLLGLAPLGRMAGCKTVKLAGAMQTHLHPAASFPETRKCGKVPAGTLQVIAK